MQQNSTSTQGAGPEPSFTLGGSFSGGPPEEWHDALAAHHVDESPAIHISGCRTETRPDGFAGRAPAWRPGGGDALPAQCQAGTATAIPLAAMQAAEAHLNLSQQTRLRDSAESSEAALSSAAEGRPPCIEPGAGLSTAHACSSARGEQEETPFFTPMAANPSFRLSQPTASSTATSSTFSRPFKQACSGNAPLPSSRCQMSAAQQQSRLSSLSDPDDLSLDGGLKQRTSLAERGDSSGLLDSARAVALRADGSPQRLPHTDSAAACEDAQQKSASKQLSSFCRGMDGTADSMSSIGGSCTWQSDMADWGSPGQLSELSEAQSSAPAHSRASLGSAAACGEAEEDSASKPLSSTGCAWQSDMAEWGSPERPPSFSEVQCSVPDHSTAALGTPAGHVAAELAMISVRSSRGGHTWQSDMADWGSPGELSALSEAQNAAPDYSRQAFGTPVVQVAAELAHMSARTVSSMGECPTPDLPGGQLSQQVRSCSAVGNPQVVQLEEGIHPFSSARAACASPQVLPRAGNVHGSYPSALDLRSLPLKLSEQFHQSSMAAQSSAALLRYGPPYGTPQRDTSAQHSPGEGFSFAGSRASHSPESSPARDSKHSEAPVQGSISSSAAQDATGASPPEHTRVYCSPPEEDSKASNSSGDPPAADGMQRRRHVHQDGVSMSPRQPYQSPAMTAEHPQSEGSPGLHGSSSHGQCQAGRIARSSASLSGARAGNWVCDSSFWEAPARALPGQAMPSLLAPCHNADSGLRLTKDAGNGTVDIASLQPASRPIPGEATSLHSCDCAENAWSRSNLTLSVSRSTANVHVPVTSASGSMLTFYLHTAHCVWVSVK